jgi:DNA-binding XRE family transcriptional regulator
MVTNFPLCGKLSVMFGQDRKVNNPAVRLAMVQKTVGDRIYALADKHPLLGQMSRKQQAATLGVTYEAYRQWRVGPKAPNRTTAARIAEVLGCHQAEFMHGVTFGTSPGGPTQEVPAMSIDEAMGVLEVAIHAVPQARRPELGDLMRPWAIYGTALFRRPITELLAATTSGPVDVPRPSGRAALLAQVFEALPSSQQDALISKALQLQRQADAQMAANPADTPTPEPTPEPKRARGGLRGTPAR